MQTFLILVPSPDSFMGCGGEALVPPSVAAGGSQSHPATRPGLERLQQSSAATLSPTSWPCAVSGQSRARGRGPLMSAHHTPRAWEAGVCSSGSCPPSLSLMWAPCVQMPPCAQGLWQG